MKKRLILVAWVISCVPLLVSGQDAQLTLDRIYSNEFRQSGLPALQWVDGGEAYAVVEQNTEGLPEIAKYTTSSGERSLLVEGNQLFPNGKNSSIGVESFDFSPDKTKLMIFTNSSRVWRANTKGDYWVLDLESGELSQLGSDFPASSLMFAKFSEDQKKAAYVYNFNLYVEDLETGSVTQLTKSGGEEIINGTFDWAYEEEFGARDGFRWSPSGQQLAFWNFDISKVGTFYMINNIDSVYSELIPLQYPKVGQDPSSVKIGLVGLSGEEVQWIPIPGSSIQNYIPGMQWVDAETLLIQQLNRHQSKLTVWRYNVISEELKEVYVETEDTWVDIYYPDVSAGGWEENDLKLVDNGTAFLRMTENDGWRHVYKVDIMSGDKTLLTPSEFDVASIAGMTEKELFFHASPENTTQRYLYKTDLKGKGKISRLTPDELAGINLYNCSPNGEFAILTHSKALSPNTYHLIDLEKHEEVRTLEDNATYKHQLANLALPEVEFFRVTTDEGVQVDGRMIKPVGFDASKKYPVLFHVYGEPWGAVATDNFVGLWNIMLAQKGYIIIDMDNRGTPCLKGSEWRKSIYRKVGVINAEDQAMAGKKVLSKYSFIDPERVAVWGWSGGGSMTQNLLFKHPEIYKVGMAVAGVSMQLIYDNIYQERYMGLPQENLQDFIKGSPITYAKNLQGDLLLVHGTNDDNVHYQSQELLVNELIRYNKQFDMMAYPNRSHGIYEGPNTRRHLYTLLTNYLMEHVPVND
ncbi:DPP IV N-terminal domain-containing protein [Echinicola sp. CAU 1574]|uniref:DPP IV N-terminal domain-containing protein n=1 Tax=Echinicola arenosa TaxID=2774144 RepID=A0ABR9AML7_9BACT|nr:DPP IV N-terminal domain-containing protein [Echinicola arenosa]MBD8488869.1 DPP IV N-terminal domain-containing protein [Echinicola arenosa]